MKRKVSGFVVILSVAAFLPGIAAADSCVPSNSGQNRYSAKLAQKGELREQAAEKILNRIQSDAESAERSDGSGLLDRIGRADATIPAKLLNKAKCVVVIPHELDVGVFIGGVNGGEGVSMCRGSDGKLDQPSFVKLGGGAYGPQLGMRSTDQVLLFMNSDAPETLQSSRIELGADLAVAAGPVGRDVEGEMSLPYFQDEVLSYSHTRGLYAGATLNGEALIPDVKTNEAVAGQNVQSVFSKIGHGFVSIFHHPKNECDAELQAADSASDVNAAVNSPDDTAPDATIVAQADADQKTDVPAEAPATQSAPALATPTTQAGTLE